MSTVASEPVIFFPDGYDARREFETSERGYLSQVVVQVEGGKRYRLFFYDPVRMQQDLEEQVKLGRGYLAEPNLILLPDVTTDNIKKAVAGLWQDGFFQHLRSV
jgi:hypothetical protein